MNVWVCCNFLLMYVAGVELAFEVQYSLQVVVVANTLNFVSVRLAPFVASECVTSHGHRHSAAIMRCRFVIVLITVTLQKRMRVVFCCCCRT